MSEKELILKVSHLQKSFGNHAVLNDIDFEALADMLIRCAERI